VAYPFRNNSQFLVQVPSDCSVFAYLMQRSSKKVAKKKYPIGLYILKAESEETKYKKLVFNRDEIVKEAKFQSSRSGMLNITLDYIF
jgi:hypothetical protein